MKKQEIIKHVNQSFHNWIESEGLSEYRNDLDFAVRETAEDEHCLVEICFDGLLYDLINNEFGYLNEEKAEKIFGLSKFEWEPYSSWKIDIHKEVA